MHRLLIRQLLRHLGKSFVPDEQFRALLEVISAYYHETDQEKSLLENALAVNSDELTAVNEQLRAQSELEHALLYGVMDSIPDLIFFKTPESVYLGCNRAFEKCMGVQESALIGKMDHDFMDAARAASARQLDQQMLAQVKPQLNEEWVAYPGGRMVCLEVLRTPYFCSDGNLLGLIGICRDVTDRKHLEEEMRVASLVYQHTGEGMLVTDANNCIIAINPAGLRIAGFSLEEMLGKNPNTFKSGRHDAGFYQSMWQAINEIGFWHGEIWDRRKNGEIYAKWLTINRLMNANGAVHGYVALFSDITEKKLTEELIWRQANFDMLCGLPNRRMFADRLEEEIKKEQRAGTLLAVLFIDLDHFKGVNDTLGHHVGDVLLVETARRIRACVRDSDTVARMGGDEFTVILPHLVNSDHVEGIAQEIINSLAQPFLLGKETAYVSASIGITLYPNDATRGEQLLKNADQAMYVAKSKGRNCFSYFTFALQVAAHKRSQLLGDMHSALEASQFRVYFQPIVELASGRIHKAEALVRWQHPVRGMVGPLEFIPLAEETGLIVQIGDWVFRESACWAVRWDRLSPTGFQVSVNKSPVQFRAAAKSVKNEWMEHLAKLKLPGRCIAIEITEGLLLNTDKHVADKLLMYRNAGIQVAIDDFGTGYSSLAYLKKFDIDYLKIDQSFVHNLATDSNDKALCEAIIVMAHKLGLKVIAEGVETKEQKDLLDAFGCDYAQGYLFSRPIPPEEFEMLLLRGLPEM